MARTNRDPLLDFWRGLCLLDVVLVHLAYNEIGFPAAIEPWIREYTRFAAGGFVLLSGLTVGVAFGPAVSRGGEAKRETYARLVRRAGLLVAVDVLASIALRVVDLVRFFPAHTEAPLAHDLLQILALQRPGITGGILLLYALLLLLCPVLFELRARRGALSVAALSAGPYALAVATGGALAWPPWDFPLAYWQPLFVAGFLAVPLHAWLRDGGLSRAVGAATAASAVFGFVFLLRFGPQFGVEALAAAIPLPFIKSPLLPGELVWYVTASFAVFAWANVLWRTGGSVSLLGRNLATLGRHSLLVYTAHVFTEIAPLEFAWSRWPSALVRLLLAASDLVALALLCAIAEAAAFHRLRARLGEAGAWLWRLPVQPVEALAVASVTLALLVAHAPADPALVGAGEPLASLDEVAVEAAHASALEPALLVDEADDGDCGEPFDAIEDAGEECRDLGERPA